MTIAVTIGYRMLMKPHDLKQWKERLNCNQVALAEMLGVTKMCVSRWERGDRKIPPFLIYALKWLEVNKGGVKRKGNIKTREKGE